MTAQTAATLDKLTRGRFILGLGVSGRGVVEGWHGQPYGSPLECTREYVEIIRRITSQRRPVTFAGSHYTIPYRAPGDDAPRAKPLRFGLRPARERIPIYLAAQGPKNLELASTIADGTILQLYSPFRDDLLFGDLRPRFGEDGTKVVVNVAIAPGRNTDDCLDALRPYVAFWIGKMGSGGVNFYRNVAERLGFPESAAVSEAFARGDVRGAARAVPRAMVDELCLCGPLERIRDRLEAWKASACTTMLLCGIAPEHMGPIAELAA
jgi:F420-dependent oxidoreductase-like protein